MADEVKWQSEGATEKWIQYYSSNHQILLVGEGDFSFSLCLAHSFASASNIVASSLDSYDDVTKKYKEAKSNLEKLKKLRACLLHGVDATKMKFHPDLQMRRFDRVIFNFPHAGFHGKEDNPLLIKKHMSLVHGFFTNATALLRADGEIHINHKTEVPYSNWNLGQLGSQSSLLLIECADFKKEDYPGYKNKRGDGSGCDEPFRLGKCCTFKFIYNPKAMGEKMMGKHIQQRNYPSQESQALQWPSPVDLNHFPQMSQIPTMNARLPLATRNEHYHSFGGISCYMEELGRTAQRDHLSEELLGRTSQNSYYSRHGERPDFETYIADPPAIGRTLNGDIYIQRELQRLKYLPSGLRIRNMVWGSE